MARRKRFRKEPKPYTPKKDRNDRIKIAEALGWHLWYPFRDIGSNYPKWYMAGGHYDFSELPEYEKVTTPKTIRFLVNNKTEEQLDDIRDRLFLQVVKKVHGINANTMDEYYASRSL